MVVLDTRYANVPGWKPLANRGWLGNAAEICSVAAGQAEPNYTVDGRGWKPAEARIQGPALPGLAGVVQAQHNLLVSLHDFPNALNLRRVLHSQGHISHELARRSRGSAPELEHRFLDRAQTFKALLTETRNVGGLVGNGGQAAADSMSAMSRLERAPGVEEESAEQLRQLDRSFTRTDARLASIIDRGIREKLYCASTRISRPIQETNPSVNIVRERWLPITSPAPADLQALARDRLRPPAVPDAEPAQAQSSREAYEAALHHRPRRSGPAR